MTCRITKIQIDKLYSWRKNLDYQYPIAYAKLNVGTVVVVDVDLSIDFPHDQKDSMFLACAVATGANYFITGDGDVVHAEKLVATTILSVSQFKKLVCDML